MIKINKKYFYLFGGIIILVLVMFLLFGLKGNKGSEYNSLSEIQEKGVLVVGTSPPYGIMEFYDENNELVGLDMDIAKAIADDLGLSLEIKDVDFDNLLNSLNTGEIDLAIATITLTDERNKNYLGSISYFSGGQSVVTSSEQNINYFIDLNGKVLGIEDDGTSLHKAILDYVEGVELISYRESDGLTYVEKVVLRLKSGDIDGFVVDYIAAIGVVEENPEFKIVGTPFTHEYYGIYSNLENADLIDEVNRVLQEMKRNGDLKKIENKWS